MKTRTIGRRHKKQQSAKPKKEIENKVHQSKYNIYQERLETELLPSRLSLANPYDWIPFFDWRDKFLAFMIVAARQSPTHSRCIGRKAEYSVGEGFSVSESPTTSKNIVVRSLDYLRRKVSPTEEKDTLEQINDVLAEVNPKGETALDVMYKVFLDYFTCGNAYVEYVSQTIRGVKVVFMYHVPVDEVRLGLPSDEVGDLTHVMVSPYFKDPYWKATKQPRRVGLYPYFSKAGGVTRTVYRMFDYRVGNRFYGVPREMSAMLAMSIEHKNWRWNYDMFENGMMPSLIANFYSQMSEANARKFKNNFVNDYTGEGSARKVIMNVLASKEGAPDFLVYGEQKDGDFDQLNKSARDIILMVHGMHPSLAGIMTPGKLGTSNEIKNAYQLFLKSEIEPVQQKAIRCFIHPYLKMRDESLSRYSLSFVNGMPVGLADSIKPNEVLTKDEQRKELGYAPMTEEQKAETDG